MMKVCILDKTNNTVVNIADIEIENWVDHGNLILAERHDGEIGWTLEAGQWNKHEKTFTTQEKWLILREQRNECLTLSDRFMMPDFPLEAGELDSWKTYRQNLRNITESLSDPDAVVWPTPPRPLRDLLNNN